MPKSFRNLLSGTDGIVVVVVVVVQGCAVGFSSMGLVSKQTNYERTDNHEHND